VQEYPHLAILDPRTGRKIWSKEGWTMEHPVTAESFLEIMSDFGDRNSFDKPPSAPPAPPAPPGAAADLNEDEALAAAIAASMSAASSVLMSQQQKEILCEWQGLLDAKRAFVYPLATYQGRVAEPGRCSTNGCAVIAPLIAAEHLRSEGGVSDEAVEEIIDKHAGPWLEEIRGKLGLGGAAFIVPSDVHDQFVDHK
jgi:hypothetical protein